jgi:DNA-binding transcriptional regulator WhiA
MAESRERELAQTIRAELAAIDPPRACCRNAERAGLGAAGRGHARSPAIARLAVRLADDTRDEGGEPPLFTWPEARDHCRSAWLRGRFLASGSLSLGARGAHLEFVVGPDEGEDLRRHLDESGFPTSMRARRGRSVLTIKRTDTILALLRYCGAGASVLEIESRLVMRQLQGHLNRVLNAETANLERTVASSARQIAIIEQLEGEGRLGQLPAVDQSVARARKDAPEASFTELAATLGLSRARVQRAFGRIEAAAATGPSPAD